MTCLHCGYKLDGSYHTERVQVSEDVLHLGPDGSGIRSTPFAAVFCSLWCTRNWLNKQPEPARPHHIDPDSEPF